jgi:hypothetical protein
VPLLCLRLSLQVHGNEVIQIMSFMSNHVIHVKSCHSCHIISYISNHVIHVKSCHSCQIMSFMSNHVIHVKSCHSCQIQSFMSNHVIHVKSCHSCQIMSFMSNHVIHVMGHRTFPAIHLSREGREGREGGSNMPSYAFGDSFAVCPKAKNNNIFALAVGRTNWFSNYLARNLASRTTSWDQRPGTVWCKL